MPEISMLLVFLLPLFLLVDGFSIFSLFSVLHANRRMSTCRWCTPGGALTTELLKKYATKELPNEDIVGANEDLCYCMQCVGEYHRVRDEVPLLHKALWQMETARLIIQLEKSMQEEIEEDDELFLVEEDGEKQLFGYTGPNFESNLRVPLLEILKYPYLLLNKHVTELCTEALCKMEHANNPFQVYEKLPGVYLLLVHPNEAVRRWAIMTARTQGKVDRDDYYDLKEVFTCLFKVIELGLFENPDIYGNSEVEEGKLILLPSHLYDISNYKNYWLGICMLLTVLEEQAMDSLLLSHDKQNDFMQSILHVMEKNTEDENANPFWPALHCFMIILDRLGSKVWGQLIDPIQAFQTIISSPSYTSEIETIRNSYSRPTKMEQHNDDNDLDISCSQMVYSFKTEKPNKDTGWKKAISPDYCPNMYEEMQSLANVLQSEIGQDMRVHDSTFLWFLPYVQSVMDLKDLGVPYIIEVIHHLYFEIKDVLNQRVQQCDKVTELFVLVLVSIIELHRNKKCLYLLWVSCHKWVEALVRCSLLPVKDVQAKSNSKMAYGITCSPTQSSSSVQHSCLQLIRSILREGCQLGQQTTCMQYLDKLNLVLRGNMSRTLELNSNEVRDLQACLRQIVKIIKDKASAAPSSTLEQNTNRIEFVPFIKSESVDDDEYWDRACSSLEKPSPATSPTEGFDGACWLTVKREPEEDKCSESELNYCKPTSSTVAVGIKKESIIQSEPAPPALTGEQQNRKPKQNLSELKSKLSKVLQKSSFKRQNSLPENINQKDEVEKQVPLESSEKCIPSTKPVKSEPHDSLFKPPSCNSSYSCSSSNIAVTKQLQRLSLENRDPEVKTVSVKTEAPLEDRQAPLENQISVVNSCEKRSSEPASEHCETSSPDDDDNLPLFVLRKKLLQKNKTQLTDSQVDRDLDALSMAAQAKSMNFHLDSSQDSVISQDQCQIQRKVKGTARSPHIDSSSSDTDISSDHIITISDSEDEESPNIATIKSEKTSPRGVCPSTSTSEFSKQIAEAQIKSEPPPSLTCDDYDSQLFEFETEDEVYSVWQDPYDDQKKPVVASSHSETSAELPISDPADTDMNNEFNEWGYDTDYISDDVLEKAAEAAEEMLTDSKQGNGLQKKNESVGSEGNLSVKGVHSSSFYRKDTQVTTAKQGEKTNIHISPKEASPLPSKVVHGKKTETVVAQKVKSKSKELKRTKSPLKSRGENVRRESLIRTSPAVVPPKKIRTGPDPSSTVEKLGFKKAPRKAFDLSQRSLDSLAELRNHGKMAGVVEPKRTKTKLISPQSLMVKCNKQMLACQDRQFYLQSRPKIHGKRKQAEASEGRSRKPENSSHKVDKNGNSGHFQATSSHAEVGSSTPRDDLKLSNNKECLEMSRTSANMSTAQNVEVPLSSKVENSSSHLLEKSVPSLSGDNAPTDDKESNYDEDDNDLFLTQMDPVDMEICSQVEYDIAIGDLEKGDTPQISNFSGSDAEMAKFATGIGTELPKMDDGLPMCKYRDCPEMVKDAGDHCPKHTPPEKVEDHLFAKPGLPPSLQKLSKPSTTKVFVLSNTSRTASLTKDIENLRQPQNATKAPIPKLPKPLTAQNRALDANSVLKPLNNQSNIPSKPSYTAVPEAGKSSPYTSQKPLQQRDQGWLMRELLRWTFEMFDNVSQFGPPSNLSQLPLVKVPLKFSSYEEYFNVYFPLMLLNTFESLAQDWSVKQQAINTHMCKLHLQTFCPDAQVNRGEFLAWFRDTDLCVQRHPKEDDLVFLCLPESGEEAQSHGAMVYHTGYVSRFNRSQKTVNQEKEQYTLCDLCIQTKGNLSAFRNQQVRCFVIGSLITTQRQFRALLQLQRNPLFRPIIMPNPTDFFPRDNVASETSSFPSLKEYNSDQKYAIERAYVMVKQQPRLPRICLIHGPPGTGKSKTIVGLLYRILMEKDSSSTVPVQNLNAKNKRNRVLVCAPSNAALDDLMKKIILEFKEKCYNKNNPLGNCGDINLVRLGAEKTISNDVVKFSLDCQVNHRITRAQQDQGLHKQKEMLDKKLDELSRRRALEKCNKNTCVPLDEEIARLSKERQLLANSLKEVRRRPQELQRTIILESHVICCTLSTSGGILLESAFRQLGQEPFSCVIVDEASQSCEVETLIPLLHRCSKLVLVGDPEQLPPTVISMKAEDLGYGQSLMSRMCRFLESTGTKSPVLQLTMQYRMHPDICLFPSHYFYKRMLKTDRATEEVRCSSDWPFQPYMVFDVADGYERKERESFCNPQEIKVAVALIKLIKSRKKDFCFRNIGVITPYRAQKMRIIEELKRAFANDIKPGEVDTVDGFQGRQKDCIIVTCVRANSTQGSIGFLASRQRLNVTITRAKFSLFILGSLRTLMENKDWNHLIQDAQRRGALIKTKEEHYQRDVNRILKLKPVVQRAPLNPSSRPEEKHKDNAATSPRIETPVEITQPPRKPLCPPSRPVIHPAVDCRRDSFKTRNAPSGSTVGTLPHAQRSKLQDPRLARPPPTSNSAQNSTHSSRPSSSVAGSSHPARRDSRTVSDGSRSSNSWNRDWDRGRKRTSELEQDPKKRKLSR